jgi:anti-sigma factor RsiW
MSNCETVREDLKAYLDGQLPLLRKSEVALHLAGCAACRQEAEALRQIGGSIHAIDNEPLDIDVRARILERVRNAEEEGEESGVLPGRRG